jgi:hypothetical protein
MGPPGTSWGRARGVCWIGERRERLTVQGAEAEQHQQESHAHWPPRPAHGSAHSTPEPGDANHGGTAVSQRHGWHEIDEPPEDAWCSGSSGGRHEAREVGVIMHQWC